MIGARMVFLEQEISDRLHSCVSLMTGFLSILVLLYSFQGVEADCPTGAIYDASFNRCYKYVNSPKSFSPAEQDCNSIGGHLLSIQNGFENGLVAGTAPTYFGQSSYWIGAQFDGFSWSWTDGLPFTYANWEPNQPDNSKTSAYVDPMSYHWSTDTPSVARPYVCVVPQEVPTTLGPCPTTAADSGGYCEDGWAVYRTTDSCYKKYFEKDFDDAEKACKGQGGHLASVHSVAENTFIIGLATTGLKNKLDTTNMTWIGLKKERKGWEWTDGTPTDYLNWEEGEPASLPLVEENCASLISDMEKLRPKAYMQWRNVHCGKNQRAFICKKKALH